MSRSLKTSKRRAEILCRRLVFDRARPRYQGEPLVVYPDAMCEFVGLLPGMNPTMDSTPAPGGGYTVRCKSLATDWAHIVPRRFSVTRCRPDNAWALCRTHHELVDRDPEAKRTLVELTIGLDRWAEIREAAYAGLAGVQLSPLMFWRAEEDVLEIMCRADGIPTTYRGT